MNATKTRNTRLSGWIILLQQQVTGSESKRRGGLLLINFGKFIKAIDKNKHRVTFGKGNLFSKVARVTKI
jgi:hypothetical protein